MNNKEAMKIGDQVAFHTKVNIDPLGSHCSLCGRKTQAKFWFQVNWNDELAMPSQVTEKGFFPVGSECAKQFEAGITVERS